MGAGTRRVSQAAGRDPAHQVPAAAPQAGADQGLSPHGGGVHQEPGEAQAAGGEE